MSRRTPATGLEAAPDIMLLTMAGLMVAIVWLAAHAQERTLAEVALREAALREAPEAAPTAVRLRAVGGAWSVWIEDRPLDGGLEALGPALEDRGAQAVTLYAERATPWEQVLATMQVASDLGLPVSVASEPDR